MGGVLSAGGRPSAPPESVLRPHALRTPVCWSRCLVPSARPVSPQLRPARGPGLCLRVRRVLRWGAAWPLHSLPPQRGQRPVTCATVWPPLGAGGVLPLQRGLAGAPRRSPLPASSPATWPFPGGGSPGTWGGVARGGSPTSHTLAALPSSLSGWYPGCVGQRTSQVPASAVRGAVCYHLARGW